MLKIGFCANPDQAAAVAAAGFDYIELPVNYIAGLNDADFTACRQVLADANISVPAFNLLFPKQMQLLEAGTEDREIADYLHAALERVRELGGTTAVFGSGKSRNRPDALAYGEAFRRLTQVTRLTGEIAEQHGVTIVIEPLNRGETNMINSLGEGACLVAAANHPRVKLLADYYHIAVEGQPEEDILRLGGIAHAHIATREGRRVPTAVDAGYARMFSAMKQTGYTGLLSIEGKTDNLAEDGPAAIRMLRSKWEEA